MNSARRLNDNFTGDAHKVSLIIIRDHRELNVNADLTRTHPGVKHTSSLAVPGLNQQLAQIQAQASQQRELANLMRLQAERQRAQVQGEVLKQQEYLRTEWQQQLQQQMLSLKDHLKKMRNLQGGATSRRRDLSDSCGGYTSRDIISGILPLGGSPAMRNCRPFFSPRRVGAGNYLFVNASNQLGQFEVGITAALFGAMPAAVLGRAGNHRRGAALHEIVSIAAARRAAGIMKTSQKCGPGRDAWEKVAKETRNCDPATQGPASGPHHSGAYITCFVCCLRKVSRVD
jgi:hypothetical protein